MDSYDLFSAMSGADEALVARSDHRVKRHRNKLLPLLAIAACFALLLIGIASRFKRPAPESLHTPPTTGLSEAEQATIPTVDPNLPLQLSGNGVGTLNVLQLSQMDEADSMPEFLMYIDSENYYLADDGKSFYVYHKNRAESKPACWLTLTWEADVTVEQVLHRQSANLSALMESVTVFDSNPLLDGPMIQGSNGSAWDAAQTEVYLVSDRHSGVFLLTLEYYLDDTDGHAVRFRDMLQTFEIIPDDRLLPDWMAELRTAVGDFTSAFLKNDVSAMDGLVSEHAQIHTYGADVRAETRILKTHYQVDSDTAPTSASVSVRHKYLEADAYDYITMELEYKDGTWQVTRAMIER